MNQSEHLHPDSLSIFFLTEMWERYGFYVIQTLLVLYLTQHFQWSDKNAFALVGTFTAMTYISSLFGGWIADHFIGQKNSIIIAVFILMSSYLLLSLLHTTQQLQWVLAGICVGTGLIKPNISSLLGNEYSINSPKRESGFTIFYIGITTGIILGSTLPNLIRQKHDWSIVFLSAALVMIFAFAIFVYGIYRFRITDYKPHSFDRKTLFFTVSLIALLYFCCLGIFHFPLIANSVFASIVFLCCFYLCFSVISSKKQQAKQNLIIGLLCFISTLFWAFYFQMFSSFSLLITRIVAPSLFGVSFPAPYYVAIQSLGLIVFGLLLAKPKKYPNLEAHATHIGRKFALAMFLITIAYSVTTLILHFDLSSRLLSPLYLIPSYLLISVAELLLSPVGLAAITLLASPKKVSTMMGIFFVSLGAGAFLSGKLAAIAALPDASLPIQAAKEIYAKAFSTISLLIWIATGLSFFMYLFIKSLLKTQQEPNPPSCF